jgi:hypothetical protein
MTSVSLSLRLDKLFSSPYQLSSPSSFKASLKGPLGLGLTGELVLEAALIGFAGEEVSETVLIGFAGEEVSEPTLIGFAGEQVSEASLPGFEGELTVS